VPGAYVVTLDAEPALYVERGGKGIITLRDDPIDAGGEPAAWVREALEALADHVHGGGIKRLGLERFDGEPVIGSPFGALLIELGFRQTPRKLTLTA
jgi:ATP-dependent Lhr-like helicase